MVSRRILNLHTFPVTDLYHTRIALDVRAKGKRGFFDSKFSLTDGNKKPSCR